MSGELNQFIENGFTIKEAQPTPPAGPKRLRHQTGDQLMKAHFDPLNVVVDGLVTEGLTMLASGPKLGKSFMCLDMAAAVTNGNTWLGRQTKAGAVLYLAYEDPARRLKDRMERMRLDVNERFHFETQENIITIDEGLVNALDAFLDETQGITLVIIDTLAAIRGNLPRGVDVFQRDYNTIQQLKAFADRRHIALLLLHHTHKGSSRDEDILDKINGSTGLSAAADALFILERKRGEADGFLHVQHREYPEKKLELYFENCRWHLYNPGELLRLQYEAAPVVKTLKSLLGAQLSAHLTYADLSAHALEIGTYVGNTTQNIHKSCDAWAEQLARYDGIYCTHRKQPGGKFGIDVTVIPPKGSH